jgi:hypothetical protein
MFPTKAAEEMKPSTVHFFKSCGRDNYIKDFFNVHAVIERMNKNCWGMRTFCNLFFFKSQILWKKTLNLKPRLYCCP